MTHTSTRDSRTLAGKSGSVSCGVTGPFSWILVHTRFCCALQESVSLGVLNPFAGSQGGGSVVGLELLQQCENFGKIVLQFMGSLLGGSVVGLMATSSKRAYATHHASQVCCSQNICPPGRSLLTHASTGDNQTDRCRPGSVSCGSHGFFPSVLVHTRFCLCPSSVSGVSVILF